MFIRIVFGLYRKIFLSTKFKKSILEKRVKLGFGCLHSVTLALILSPLFPTINGRNSIPIAWPTKLFRTGTSSYTSPPVEPHPLTMPTRLDSARLLLPWSSIGHDLLRFPVVPHRLLLLSGKMHSALLSLANFDILQDSTVSCQDGSISCLLGFPITTHTHSYHITFYQQWTSSFHFRLNLRRPLKLHCMLMYDKGYFGEVTQQYI